MALPLQSEEVEIQINANDSSFLANYDDEKDCLSSGEFLLQNRLLVN